MELTDFLLARIAEDEATAPFTGSGLRVLAECEAKRRIVELRYSWNLQAERSPEPPFGPILQSQVITADTVLRTLATIYSDHPDYRSEWAP